MRGTGETRGDEVTEGQVRGSWRKMGDGLRTGAQSRRARAVAGQLGRGAGTH
jgi:hypothetical protein